MLGWGSDCNFLVEKIVPFCTEANGDLLLVGVGLFLRLILVIRLRTKVFRCFIVLLLVVIVGLMLLLLGRLVFVFFVVEKVLFGIGHKI